MYFRLYTGLLQNVTYYFLNLKIGQPLLLHKQPYCMSLTKLSTRVCKMRNETTVKYNRRLQNINIATRLSY